jgi:phage host-nuclease inhibitor protein Gam
MARKKVQTEPTMQNWAAVDGALRDIRECRHMLTELEVERDRQIDSAKDDYAKNALPMQNRIKRLEADIREYSDAHRAEMAGKSRTLNFGVVGYRISNRLMLAPAKVADAIAALKSMGHKELIKTTETLDRDALKRQPDTLLNQIGAYVSQKDEFYYDVEEKQPDKA